MPTKNSQLYIFKLEIGRVVCIRAFVLIKNPIQKKKYLSVFALVEIFLYTVLFFFLIKNLLNKKYFCNI